MRPYALIVFLILNILFSYEVYSETVTDNALTAPNSFLEVSFRKNKNKKSSAKGVFKKNKKKNKKSKSKGLFKRNKNKNKDKRYKKKSKLKGFFKKKINREEDEQDESYEEPQQGYNYQYGQGNQNQQYQPNQNYLGHNGQSLPNPNYNYNYNNGPSAMAPSAGAPVLNHAQAKQIEIDLLKGVEALVQAGA